jgi:hypothetical protein
MLDIIAEVPTIDANTKSMLIDLVNKFHEDGSNSSIIQIGEFDNYVSDIEKHEATQVIINNKKNQHITSKSNEISSVMVLDPNASASEDMHEVFKYADTQHPWLKVLELRMKMIKSK